MVIRQRAIQAEAKQERHHAILDAAERLLFGLIITEGKASEILKKAGLTPQKLEQAIAELRKGRTAQSSRSTNATSTAFSRR